MYLERCLEIGIDHALQEQRYGVRIDDTCKEVERLIQNALDNETDSEERYWALMSRAELKIVTQEQKETGDTIEKITKDIQAAVELAGPRSFLLDSTLQQFRMMLELGFQTELLLAAVEKLETAWLAQIQKITATKVEHIPLPPEIPVWLSDLFDLIQAAQDADLHQRWTEYRNNPEAVRVFRTLSLKWEPIEQLTPKLPIPPTLGFEILGMDVSGAGYGPLIKTAKSAAIDLTDLKVALFVLSLRTVRLLRILLQERAGHKASRLYFSLNFDDEMMRFPAIRTIIDRFFLSGDESSLFFEISENLPKKVDHIDALKAFLNTYKILAVLDDSNAMNSSGRQSLSDITCKTKADNKYTGSVMKTALPTSSARDHVISDLGRFCIDKKAYIIEGIENREMYDFLQGHWPEDQFPNTGMQGWCIKINKEWNGFFEPLRDSKDQPGGYRLQAWVEDRLDLY